MQHVLYVDADEQKWSHPPTSHPYVQYPSDGKVLDLTAAVDIID